MIKYSQKKIPCSEWQNIKKRVKYKLITNGLKMDIVNEALIEIVLSYVSDELLKHKYMTLEPSEKDLQSQNTCCIVLDAIKKMTEEK